MIISAAGHGSASELSCDTGTWGALRAQARYVPVLRACTPAITMVIGFVGARAAELLLVVPLLLRHVRAFCSHLLLDGSMTLDQLRRTMYLQRAAD